MQSPQFANPPEFMVLFIHVHLWNLDEKNLLFEAHLDIDDMMVSQAELMGMEIEELLRKHFAIAHTTLQFECVGCRDCDVVNGQCCREV